MKTIYLDNAANTVLDKKVLKAMKPYLNSKFVGNANATHDYGIIAAQAVAESREIVGNAFGIEPRNVIFTSGATESNNTAIKVVCMSELYSGKLKKDQRRHIICSSTEHSSVINVCKQMEKLGFKVDYVDPDKTGCVDGLDIISRITNKTLLICVMAVNNETGSVNTHLKELFLETSGKGIYTLFDCTQLVSLGIDHRLLGTFKADFVSFSAHKINGPTGVGALLCSDEGYECLKAMPLIVGGAQEAGLRGSTSNTAGIVGLAKAVENETEWAPRAHFSSLREYLKEKLEQNEVPFKINGGDPEVSIVSLDLSEYYRDYEIDSLASLLANYGVAVSAGSACDANHDETQGFFNPSHVLVAMGLTEKQIRATIRVSFGRYTTKKDINILVERLIMIHRDLGSIE